MERLVIITGMSGSGKSLAAKCFEDVGFFCVDNLPVDLIEPFCQLIRRGGEQTSHAAMVIDARGRAALDRVPAKLAALRDGEVPVQLIFFDCGDDVLKRRFSETRRPHPMADLSDTLVEAIASERVALQPLREVADRIIDTSKYTPHELRSFLSNAYGVAPGANRLNVNVVSFGFKYGIPAEADLLFDVRFLPNPYFVEELRFLDGRTDEVSGYLYSTSFANRALFGDRLEAFEAFEADLRIALDRAEPSGRFERELVASWALGHRRA